MAKKNTKEVYAEPLVTKHEALKEITGQVKGYHEVPQKTFEVPTKTGSES